MEIAKVGSYQSLHNPSYFKYILNVIGEHQTSETLINRPHHILICIQTVELSSIHCFLLWFLYTALGGKKNVVQLT